MNRFRQARLQAGLSQKAAAISLGVKPPSMSDWETGKSRPTYDHLTDMAELYGVSLDFLLGTDPAAPQPQNEQIKKPAADSSELVETIIDQIRTLPDPALARVSDFLSGLGAGLEIRAAAPADPDPDPGQPE